MKKKVRKLLQKKMYKERARRLLHRQQKFEWIQSNRPVSWIRRTFNSMTFLLILRGCLYHHTLKVVLKPLKVFCRKVKVLLYIFRFWHLLMSYLYPNVVNELPLVSSFCQGYGEHYFSNGKVGTGVILLILPYMISRVIRQWLQCSQEIKWVGKLLKTIASLFC